MQKICLLLSALSAALFFSSPAAAGDLSVAVTLPERAAVLPSDLSLALPSDALVDEPLDPLNVSGTGSYDATDNDGFDIFTADDFTNEQGWVIRNFFVPSINLLGDMLCLESVNLQVYKDEGGVPDGDPAGGGNAPAWQIALAPTDPQVTFGYHSLWGGLTTLRVDLEEPLFLPAGSHWLVFYTTQDTVLCSFTYRSPSALAIGREGVVMRPSGIDIPDSWTPVSATIFALYNFSDFAFRIGGEACPGAVFNPAGGRLSIPQIRVDGSDTCYEAVLDKLGAGYEFSLAGAKKVPCTCPSATFTSSTGILAISYIAITGIPKTYNVELTKKVGSWVFVLSKVIK